MESNLTGDSIEWQLDDYLHFKKCGFITASPDEKCFGLNCIFCKTICLQLKHFILHIKEKHSSELCALYFTNDDDEDVGEESELIFENYMDIHQHQQQQQIQQQQQEQQLQVQQEQQQQEQQQRQSEEQKQQQKQKLQREEQHQPAQKQQQVRHNNTPTQEQPQQQHHQQIHQQPEMQLQEDQQQHTFTQPKQQQHNENHMNDDVIFTPPWISVSKPPSLVAQSYDEEMKQEVQKIILDLSECDSTNTEFPKGVITENYMFENEMPVKPGNESIIGEDDEFLSSGLPSRSFCSLEEESSSQCSSSYGSTNTSTTTKSSTASLKTTIENESVHSREALNYILQAYKNNEVLWNREHPDYKYNCKRKHYNEIARKLELDLGYIMTSSDIARYLKKFRDMYRHDLIKMQRHKGLYIPKLWCFEQMEFMRRPIEMARTTTWKPTKEEASSPTVKESIEDNLEQSKPKCLLSVDVMFKIISAYKDHPCLWNVEHPDFRSRIFRDAALNDMLREINTELGLHFTLDQLEKIIKNMRRNYSIEKRVQINAEQQMNGPPSSPSFRYYSELSKFLEPNLGPFRCSYCQAVLNTSDQYKVHKSAHDGSSPFVCSICRRGFTSSGNLTVHLRRHRGDYPFECEECGKRVATNPELVIHRRSHTGERPYMCELCGKDFNSWSFFTIHKRKHLNQPSFVCAVCQKGFYEKRKFVEHMNGHLNIRNSECNVCGKKFTFYSNLKKHLAVHEESMRHKCEICSRTFARLESLRSHMLSFHSQVQKPNFRTRKQLAKNC